MKKLYITLLAITFGSELYAQSDSKFWQNIQISESLETAEKKEKPAQFMVTFPKNMPSSWLINLGVAYKFDDIFKYGVSKALIEYHKNTLTDKEQNNFQVGYGITNKILSISEADPFSEFDSEKSIYIDADLKYVYDGVAIKNSFASTVLFSYYKDGTHGTNINSFSWYNKHRQGIFLSFYGGLQSQGIFNAKDKDSKGLIIRPLYIVGLQYQITSKSDNYNPIVRLTLDYTGRVDAINTSEYKEDYTHLFKAGADIFIAYEPVKVSIGGSFNYGSDPLKGLEKQQFWLLSLNISK
ncbi:MULTISPECIES: hypothetical protein [unclassified Chryseobacterium]|uniref:hypothetical protein n=1 Tax=unclassified Chryseobacterium TaxID=2593645 RepID=UPI00100B53BC|nr:MULTISPECIES: hypothetical protein [unclassified Chryseobacterium]RXM52878.1 hypothetical protein BOQ64_00140 [Chryseobacterium sp. CH25]RXM65929.1 hypothetical protein BOQ60_09375 [Chryseobacterium sp. CH1]